MFNRKIKYKTMMALKEKFCSVYFKREENRSVGKGKRTLKKDAKGNLHTRTWAKGEAASFRLRYQIGRPERGMNSDLQIYFRPLRHIMFVKILLRFRLKCLLTKMFRTLNLNRRFVYKHVRCPVKPVMASSSCNQVIAVYIFILIARAWLHPLSERFI